jgi:phage-related protein
LQLATIRDLQVQLTVDTDVEKGLTKAQFAFRETVREAENAQDRLDRIGRSSRNTDRDMSSLTRTLGVFSGRLGEIGLQSAFAIGKIGLLAGSLLAVAGAASSAVVPIAGLAVSLVPLAGGLAAIPGVALTAVGALTAFKLIFADVGGLLSAAWTGNEKKFSEAMQNAGFWVRDLATRFQLLIPHIRTQLGLIQDPFWQNWALNVENIVGVFDKLVPNIRDLSGVLGSLSQEVIQFVLQAKTVSILQEIFDNTTNAVKSFSGVLAPLGQGFLDLGLVGNQFILSFADNFASLAIRFGKWMSDIASSGKALEWMQAAVDTAKLLGNVLGDLGGIVKGIFTAMQTAGTGALGVLGKILEGVNTWVNSAQGQQTLVAIFKALSAIGATLTPVLEAIAKAVGGLAPGIAELAKMLGPTLTAVVDALGGGLKSALPGIEAFFGAFTDGVKSFAPVLNHLGTTFGALLKTLAPLLPALFNLASILLTSLLNAIDGILPSIGLFVNALVAFIKAVGPSLGQVITLAVQGFGAFLNVLTPLLPIAAKLFNALENIAARVLLALFKALEPVLPQLTQAATIIGDALASALIELAPYIEDFANAFLQILPAIAPLLPQFAQLAVQLLPVMVHLIEALLPIISQLAELFAKLLAQVLPLLPQLMKLGLLWVPIADKALRVADVFVNQLLPAGDKVIKWVEDLAKKVVGWFQWLFDTLIGHSIIPDIINGMRNWFKKGVDWVFDAVDFLRDLPGKIGDWFGKAKDAAVEKFSQLIDWLRGVPQSILNALGDFGRLLYDSGRNLLQGLINGLWSMFNSVMSTVGDILGRIRSAFPFSPAKWGPFSGHGYTTYSGIAMMRDFAKGIRSQSQTIRSALNDTLTHDITPSLTPTIGGFAQSMVPQVAGVGGVVGAGVGAGSIVIQNLNLNFSDDRDMYQKGQDFAAGLREYKRLGGVLPS